MSFELGLLRRYQIRNPRKGKMNYYAQVMPKCAYALNHTTYSNLTTEFVVHCCFFHGCDGVDRTAGPRICQNGMWTGELEKVRKGNKKRYNLGKINHYARSLEKYALKSKTWETASGEGNSADYNIAGYLARNLGWFRDDVALRYSCQLREQLRLMTGEETYLRPGYFWYRNAEFGKHVGEGEKRGRYGRPNPEGFQYLDGNPFHYHGEAQKETHLRAVKPTW
jgi:hypothetical protein